MMEQKTRDITMKSYLNEALDETLVASNIKDRIRVALENVPEWVKAPEQVKQECVDFVWSKTPATDYGAT